MANIRRAQPGDAEALAKLAERTFRDAFTAGNEPADLELHCARSFSPELQLREIQDPNWVTIVAELTGSLIAYAQVRLHSPQGCVSAEQPSELYRLYVSEEWHGQGIAHQVMQEVLATVARAGSDRIWLGVWEDNSRAVAFYRKFGFEVVGDHEFRFGSDRQRDLVMSLGVGGSSGA